MVPIDLRGPMGTAGSGQDKTAARGTEPMSNAHMIRTAGGEITGTFRLYCGDTHVGYVLTVARPGEGPHWTRPLGYQGRTVNGTVAEWGETKDEAMGALLIAYRAETA